MILRYAASKKHCIIGNAVFPRPSQDNQPKYLGEGREIWSGYTQSVRSCEWKDFLINIDAKTSAFYQSVNLLDFACEPEFIKITNFQLFFRKNSKFLAMFYNKIGAFFNSLRFWWIFHAFHVFLFILWILLTFLEDFSKGIQNYKRSLKILHNFKKFRKMQI